MQASSTHPRIPTVIGVTLIRWPVLLVCSSPLLCPLAVSCTQVPAWILLFSLVLCLFFCSCWVILVTFGVVLLSLGGEMKVL